MGIQNVSENDQAENDRVYLRPLVSGRDFHDTVCVNLEGDLDLRDTARCRRDAAEFELAQKVVVLGQSTFALEDLNENRLLVISRSRETMSYMSILFAHHKGR